MKHYDPSEIEPRIQKTWEEAELFSTPGDADKNSKYYMLPQLPYPSGSGLHVGHAEVYTGCDILARFKRMQGKKVLQVIGWDSFGLPAENYAIKTNVHPAQSTNDAVNNFRAQIKRLGISVDWEREVGSHNPDYYKWTQWFFLLMYKRGLAYRKSQLVNWCESCKTVLANEQVVNGLCERCDTTVLQKEMEQWYLKITEYADRLLDDLDKLDWPEETKKRQADWIGRSEGAHVNFKTNIGDNEIKVYTTRPDTLFGATYMVLAPEHALLETLKDRITNWDEIEAYKYQASAKTELERQHLDKTKTGIKLEGPMAINPVNNKEIPIFVADYVLASYGTGAIMAVPAHDERDHEFAQTFGTEIIEVVEGGVGDEIYTGEGVAKNSDFLDGLPTKEAKEKIIAWLVENNVGEKTVQYKLRDWSVSRQRFWGAPIPMLYDENGELHPVPEEHLPVLLPMDVDFKPTGQSPLTYSDDFQKGVEETYGAGWKREPDTLDTFMCSSWYYYRYLDPKNDEAFASPEALEKWMPVDFYLGGPEHVNGHLLYSRFFTKVLFDAGYIDFDEPFTVHRHQGLILGEDGRKMSKRWGNVINPDDVVYEYGADTLRVYEMFMGPLENDKPWSSDSVRGVRRFLDRVWKLQDAIIDEDSAETKKLLHQTIKKVTHDTEHLQFNTAIAQMMSFLNGVSKSGLSQKSFHIFLTMLSPYAPHIAQELFVVNGGDDFISQHTWPEYDEELAQENEIELVVQVNGKNREKHTVKTGLSDDELKDIALNGEKIKEVLHSAEPKRIIVVKGKLVNIVI